MDYSDCESFVSESGTKYALLYRTLGRGNKSQVRVGVNLGTGRKVAIKLTEKDDHSLENLKQERDILLKLRDSKGIVRLHDFAVLPDDVALVFEQHPRTLFDYVHDGGYLTSNLTLDECKRIVRSIAEALKSCRQQNISHLDLKLENIMLDASNDPVLIDFGFAEETNPGVLIHRSRGSPDYISPEIVLKTQYDPEKADVWSFGVIVYALCCGVLPFRQSADCTVRKILDRIVVGAAQPLPPQTPAPIADLLSHMLEVDPLKRYTIERVLSHPLFAASPATIADAAAASADFDSNNNSRSTSNGDLADLCSDTASSSSFSNNGGDSNSSSSSSRENIDGTDNVTNSGGNSGGSSQLSSPSLSPSLKLNHTDAVSSSSLSQLQSQSPPSAPPSSSTSGGDALCETSQ